MIFWGRSFLIFFLFYFRILRTQSRKYEVLGGQLSVTFYWIHITFAFSMLILWSPLIISHCVNMRVDIFMYIRKCQSKSPHNVEQNYKDIGNPNDYLMFIRYSRNYGHNPAEFDALLHVNVPQQQLQRVFRRLTTSHLVLFVSFLPCLRAMSVTLSILSTTINHALEM